jgi:hypothetical protein
MHVSIILHRVTNDSMSRKQTFNRRPSISGQIFKNWIVYPTIDITQTKPQLIKDRLKMIFGRAAGVGWGAAGVGWGAAGVGWGRLGCGWGRKFEAKKKFIFIAPPRFCTPPACPPTSPHSRANWGGALSAGVV